MTTPYDDGPQWAGEMLDRPEMVDAFARQFRQSLAYYVEYFARIRRDAEAMWDANPVEGFNTFEAWWRARWVKAPWADIQEHLEAAVADTFKLEARYRKGRHELPERKQASRQAKALPQGGGRGPALGSGQFGYRTPEQQARQAHPGSGPAPDQGADEGGGFLDMIRGRSA
ncbi:hypothetical protein [Actinomadura sp. 6N118]|uniref:hypothetical protein n=1 Tax=Actinomadura sp. 6N118 TaxID=3375151 RepID=UPI00379CC5C8